MKYFYSAHDVTNIESLLEDIAQIKSSPLSERNFAEGKCIVLLFFNPSLRTKLSTQKAALNLGMQVINMDMKDSWAWEIKKGAIMNELTAEHIQEAAGVISSYADVIAVRSFPGLKDRVKDYEDELIQALMHYAQVPVINLESCIRHPLQSLTDLFSIREAKGRGELKVVLSWAPHPKALPQAVANSFLEWMHLGGYQVTVTHPEGYELNDSFMQGHIVEYDQNKAFRDADIVYVKNWSSYELYGKVLLTDPSWMITASKMSLTNNASLMHCLPARRNVVIADDAMDSAHSIIQEQAANRLYTAQAVLRNILKSE